MPDADNHIRHRIGGWLRQGRHRAKKSGMLSDITLDQAMDILDFYESKCAYCSSDTSSVEFMFPISKKGPCVQANIVPICDGCKLRKNNMDPIEFVKCGYISMDKFRAILSDQMKFRNSNLIKDLVKGWQNGANGRETT